MSQEQVGNGIPVDNPIRKREQDLLGRTSTAQAFVRHVLALDASQGIVIGVFGPWGSGKTSFLNLARQDLEQEDVPILEFNPWLFSGTEQLINRFLAELSAELKVSGRKLRKAGKAIAAYGNALQGKVGISLRLIAIFLRRRYGTIDSRRAKVCAALKKSNKPIAVVLDDVDRLSTIEIRDIFKFVRLTASFPNVIYIVACDRLRVEQALEQEITRQGRDYLEKIVQLNFNLPESPKETLQDELSAAIDGALSEIGCTSKIDDQVWADVYPEIILPLIRNIRDVRRYAASAREAISSLHRQVALADVLALEAVRLFLPDVFKNLSPLVSSLTVASLARTIERHKESQIARVTGADRPTKEQFQALVGAAGSETGEHVVSALLRRLFPTFQFTDAERKAAEQNVSEPHLLARRRVAHESILRLYLERVVDGDLRAFQDAVSAFEQMTDLNAFEEFMASIDPFRLEAVIRRIGDFNSQFRLNHIEVGTTGILNLGPRLPRTATDHNARSGLTSVVQLLMETLDSTEAIASMVRRVLPQLKTLSSKWILVRAVTFQPKTSANFVSKEDSDSLSTAVGNAIRSANVDDLIEERNPAKLLRFAQMTESEFPLHISESPGLTYVILRDSLTESGSSALRSRARRVTSGVHWNLLTEIYGTGETVRARIESLYEQFGDMVPWFEDREISLDEARSLIEIAQQGEEPNPE